MSDRYSHMGELTMFGLLANAFEGGGDRGKSFPQSDAEDFSRGARFIPGEVTLARRRGERVDFINQCSQCCWYWLMSDGARIYHFDRYTYESIASENGRVNQADTDEPGGFRGDAGPCPSCGNPYTNGGTVKP